MKVNLEKEQNNLAKLTIEVPAQDALTEYNKAVKNISAYVNIPGFRKGKAPQKMVESQVGVERIKQEALEALLPKALQDAIVQNELDIVAQPYVESFDFNLGEDLKVIAKVELRPEVTLGEYKNMTVKAEDYQVPADAFDKSIENLQQQYAEFQSVSDRKTKESDVVVIDFDGSVEGEKIQGGAAQNYSLDLSNSNFIKGFAEQLVDKELNSEFDIEVSFPEDYHEEKLAGKPAIFKIKLNEIKEKVLPELTDEFAQKVGDFKTVEDLKADIKKYLETTKENENKKNANNAVFEKVVSSAKVEIQSSMIERETQSLFEEYKQRLMMQGFDWQKAVDAQGQDKIIESLKEEAQSRIKNSLVIDKIAKEENIRVEASDLDKKIQELQAAYRMEKAEFMKQLSQNPEIISSLSQQALNEKVTEFLMANNKVEFKASK